MDAVLEQKLHATSEQLRSKHIRTLEVMQQLVSENERLKCSSTAIRPTGVVPDESAESKLEALSARLQTEFSAEKAALQKTIKVLRTDGEKSLHTIQSLTTHNEALVAESQKLRGQIDSLKHCCEATEAQKQTLISTFEATQASWESHKQDLEQQIATLHSRATQSSVQQAEEETKLSAAQSELAAAQSELAAAQSELAELRGKLATQADEISQKTSNSHEWQDRIKQLTAQLSDLTAVQKANETEVTSMSEANAKLQRQLAAAIREQQLTAQRVQELTKLLSARDKQIEQLQREINAKPVSAPAPAHELRPAVETCRHPAETHGSLFADFIALKKENAFLRTQMDAFREDRKRIVASAGRKVAKSTLTAAGGSMVGQRSSSFSHRQAVPSKGRVGSARRGAGGADVVRTSQSFRMTTGQSHAQW